MPIGPVGAGKLIVASGACGLRIGRLERMIGADGLRCEPWRRKALGAPVDRALIQVPKSS
jgi:hypothetical protein